MAQTAQEILKMVQDQNIKISNESNRIDWHDDSCAFKRKLGLACRVLAGQYRCCPQPLC